MAKCGSVCILTLTVISVGLVWFTLNAEGYPTEEKSESSKDAKLADSNSTNLGLHWDLVSKIMEITKPKQPLKRKDDTPGRFCNHTYTTIDAVMKIDGKAILFVDKGHVIDERDGLKTYVETRFPSGPKWVHAAVYSEKTRKSYLFKHDMIYAFEPFGMTEFQLVKFSTNFNGATHDPECALKYFDYGIIYLMKRGYLYEFRPFETAVVLDYSDLKSPLSDLTVDAAFSNNNELYFVIDHAIFTVPKTHKEKEIIRGKRRNFFFNKCETN